MIKIHINSIPELIDPAMSLQDLLAYKKYSTEYLAIALNRTFVPKIKHADTYLTEGDHIDIVTPMQGG